MRRRACLPLVACGWCCNERPRRRSGLSKAEYWDLPTDREFLEEFLTYVFSTYWAELMYWPMIEGAAHEMWRDLAARYLDRAPEPEDEARLGFARATG